MARRSTARISSTGCSTTGGRAARTRRRRSRRASDRLRGCSRHSSRRRVSRSCRSAPSRLPQSDGAADGHGDEGGQARRDVPAEIADPARGRQDLREAAEGKKGPGRVSARPIFAVWLAGPCLARGRRRYPDVFPDENPFEGLERDWKRTPRKAATRAEAYALSAALKELGASASRAGAARLLRMAPAPGEHPGRASALGRLAVARAAGCRARRASQDGRGGVAASERDGGAEGALFPRSRSTSRNCRASAPRS